MSDARSQPPFGIDGDDYRLTDEQRAAFARDGFVVLRGLLTEAEVAAIEVDYQRFLSREIAVPGRDFCDMSGEYERPVEEFALINVMLPRAYYPAWCGNQLERRAASVAAQLHGPDMALDYDQLLAKLPRRPDAVFAWHQDMAYWLDTPDTRTATIWLALDDSDVSNGGMRFVPGSQRAQKLRPHRALHGDRDTSHTLTADVDTAVDEVSIPQLARGDATIHNEWVVHGSGGNPSERWRRAYVVAFRSAATVAAERAAGFTHSHEDGCDGADDAGGG